MTDAERITNEYMEKIFYYSLRKTGSREEAEELVQDIMLELFTSLSRGYVIENEPAWVWAVVRNRYARWAVQKRIGRENDGGELYDDTADDGDGPEEVLVKNEETELLYRELRLLSKGYRELISEYYFKNRKLSDIARSLSLPLGTAKRMLYESRKNIAEGMKMTRTYGKRSFAPEDFDYIGNWRCGSTEGMRIHERKIPSNILLEAYDNPSSAEALSLALGIALPYMEDEIKLLMKWELLVCEGGKYRTNIAILSADAQKKIFDISKKTSERLAPTVKDALEEIKTHPALPKNQSFEDMKLTLTELYVMYLNSLTDPSLCYPSVSYIKHFDGSEWTIMGLERGGYSDYLCDCGDDKKFSRPIQVIMLGNRHDTESLDISENDIPLFYSPNETLLPSSHDRVAVDELNSLRKRTAEILDGDIPHYLRGKAMVEANCDMRKLVIDNLIADGYIKLPADMNRSAVGVYGFKASAD